mmetsp:Transcript_31017/g.81211  ORF Transcript_31017/g.81211 Transcript_31017/m.81211 type:complete len:129 (-) Transcript_31017:26-412(-)
MASATLQAVRTAGRGLGAAGSAVRGLCDAAGSKVTVEGALGLYAHRSPGVLAFFGSHRFGGLPTEVKDAYAVLLLQRKTHMELFTEFHKGERSTADTARQVGLELPSEGEYHDGTQLVAPGGGGRKMF